MRISRDEMLMQMAQAAAKRGTCSRKQVGIIVARDGRVLVTGYNGAPAGMPHCGHEQLTAKELWYRGNKWKAAVPEGSHPDTIYYVSQNRDELTITLLEHSCPVAVHAEANAIAFAARHGIRLEGSQMYTTCSPCVPCAKLIINAGIQCVVSQEYYRDPAGGTLLASVGIEVRVVT